MVSLAISECLVDISPDEWGRIPLFLCIAERERPGRLESIDEVLFGEIQRKLGCGFSELSRIFPLGRVGAPTALLLARQLLRDDKAPFVLIVATDSLLNWQTLSAYERNDRLLTKANSNGVMPGEGAGALLVGHVVAGEALICTGLGFSTEAAAIGLEQPLRGAGLEQAVNAALSDAGCRMEHLNFRISDLSGEQYYFKEVALATARIQRARKDDFDIWHPAESIGETGAVIGIATIAVALDACRKSYAPGPRLLCIAAADNGDRAATIFQFGRAE
jgi:3-oxoacyl-[acyl-carrier-protein] synthase-1